MYENIKIHSKVDLNCNSNYNKFDDAQLSMNYAENEIE